MTDRIDIDALLALHAKATPGEWHWVIEDKSMATLGVGRDPGMGDPHVLSVSPCRSCADRVNEWTWGNCLTPSKEDADLIAALHNAFPAIASELRELRAAREWQPISSAPHTGIAVLLWQPWKSGRDCRVIGHYANGWCDRECESMQPEPTHWQPLPPAPEAT